MLYLFICSTLMCATLQVNSSQLDCPSKKDFITQLPMEHLLHVLHFNSTTPGISKRITNEEITDLIKFSIVSKLCRKLAYDFILSTIVITEEYQLFKQIRQLLYYKDQSELIHYNVRLAAERDPFYGARACIYNKYGGTYPLPENAILLHFRKEADFLFTPWGTLAFLKKSTIHDRSIFFSRLKFDSFYTNTSLATYCYKSECDPYNISCLVISQVDTQPIQKYNMDSIMGRSNLINYLVFSALKDQYYQQEQPRIAAIKDTLSPSDPQAILIPDLTEIVAQYAIEFDTN